MNSRDKKKQKANADALDKLHIEDRVKVIKTGETGVITKFNKYKREEHGYGYSSVQVRFDNYDELPHHKKVRSYSPTSLKKLNKDDVYLNQERIWGVDTHKEHFAILEMRNNTCKVEYLKSGRVCEYPIDKVELESYACDVSAFKDEECESIVKFIYGKRWLYHTKCKDCNRKNKCCIHILAKRR